MGWGIRNKNEQELFLLYQTELTFTLSYLVRLFLLVVFIKVIYSGNSSANELCFHMVLHPLSTIINSNFDNPGSFYIS